MQDRARPQNRVRCSNIGCIRIPKREKTTKGQRDGIYYDNGCEFFIIKEGCRYTDK